MWLQKPHCGSCDGNIAYILHLKMIHYNSEEEMNKMPRLKLCLPVYQDWPWLLSILV